MCIRGFSTVGRNYVGDFSKRDSEETSDVKSKLEPWRDAVFPSSRVHLLLVKIRRLFVRTASLLKLLTGSQGRFIPLGDDQTEGKHSGYNKHILIYTTIRSFKPLLHHRVFQLWEETTAPTRENPHEHRENTRKQHNPIVHV